MSKKDAPLIVHELRENGQHRIVIHNGSLPNAGAWVEQHQLASNGQYLASNGGGDDKLPLGIFTVRGVAHQQLT
jgi:hypothetical protein